MKEDLHVVSWTTMKVATIEYHTQDQSRTIEDHVGETNWMRMEENLREHHLRWSTTMYDLTAKSRIQQGEILQYYRFFERLMYSGIHWEILTTHYYYYHYCLHANYPRKKDLV